MAFHTLSVVETRSKYADSGTIVARAVAMGRHTLSGCAQPLLLTEFMLTDVPSGRC